MWSGAPFLFAPAPDAGRALLVLHQADPAGAPPSSGRRPGRQPCQCGSIESDMFLLHVCHLPMPPAELQAAIHPRLQCDDATANPAADN